MSKLINTYAFLNEKHENVDIIHDVAPKYVQTLTGKEDNAKIIFVHIYKQSQSSEPSTPGNPTTNGQISPHTPLNTKKPSVDSSNEIVGSPLRDDCEVKGLDSPVHGLRVFNPWVEVSNFTGVDLDTARGVIQSLIDDKVMKDDVGSVWVLCDAKDSENTVLLEIEADTEWFTRGVVLLRGRIELPDEKQLVQKHQKMIRHGSEPSVVVDTFFTFNNYTVFCISNDRMHNMDFLHDLTVTVNQTFNKHEHKSIVFDFYAQIFLLNTIYETIVKYHDDYDEDSDDPEYYGVRDMTLDSIVEQLNKILLSVPELHEQLDADSERSYSPLTNAILKAKNRHLTNATDKLWEILKLSSSFRDLRTAFQNIFVFAAKCNIVNMPQRDTKLGELIQDISSNRIEIPQLTGCQPLELLLEIGIEKLTHDFQYIFTNACICTANELKARLKTNEAKVEAAINVRKSLHSIGNIKNSRLTAVNEPNRKSMLTANVKDESRVSDVGFKNSRFNKYESESKIARLFQIYLLTEHLLLLHTNVGTDSANESITKQLLLRDPEPIKVVLKSDNHKIKVDVIDEKLRNAIYGKQPSAKRVMIKSQNNFKKLETCQYFSEDPLVPPKIYSHIFPVLEVNDSSAGDGGSEKYWWVTYTKIGTRK